MRIILAELDDMMEGFEKSGDRDILKRIKNRFKNLTPSISKMQLQSTKDQIEDVKERFNRVRKLHRRKK